MDYQVFLTYIVIALIIAIIIHILFKMFYFSHYKNFNKNSNKNEEFKNERFRNRRFKERENDEIVDDILNISTSSREKNKFDKITMSDNVIPCNLMTDDSRSTYEYNKNDNVVGISNRTPNLVGCTTCDINNTYTKEFMMDENVSCPTKAPPYSREKLQGYRDNFFDFRSHLWQQSSGVDAVDRMNEQLYLGDGDLPKSKLGKNISDVYDSLTKDKYHKDHCVLSQNLDDINKSPQYVMPATLGDYYTRDDWVYNEDRVMNGGLFYDGVSGLDPLMHDQMAV